MEEGIPTLLSSSFPFSLLTSLTSSQMSLVMLLMMLRNRGKWEKKKEQKQCLHMFGIQVRSFSPICWQQWQ